MTLVSLARRNTVCQKLIHEYLLDLSGQFHISSVDSFPDLPHRSGSHQNRCLCYRCHSSQFRRTNPHHGCMVQIARSFVLLDWQALNITALKQTLAVIITQHSIFIYPCIITIANIIFLFTFFTFSMMMPFSTAASIISLDMLGIIFLSRGGAIFQSRGQTFQIGAPLTRSLI